MKKKSMTWQVKPRTQNKFILFLSKDCVIRIRTKLNFFYETRGYFDSFAD